MPAASNELSGNNSMEAVETLLSPLFCSHSSQCTHSMSRVMLDCKTRTLFLFFFCQALRVRTLLRSACSESRALAAILAIAAVLECCRTRCHCCEKGQEE